MFFDLGSTLLDEGPVYERRIDAMVALSGLDRDRFVARMVEHYRHHRKGDLEMAKELGLTAPAWESNEVLYPGALACLTTAAEFFRLGVIANQPLGTEERLGALGIRGFFEVVVSSAEVGFSKPDRRIFEVALDQARCSPGSATMVGDRLDNDIVPAKALGMATIRVRQGFGALAPARNTDETADAEVDDLGALERLIRHRGPETVGKGETEWS